MWSLLLSGRSLTRFTHIEILRGEIQHKYVRDIRINISHPFCCLYLIIFVCASVHS